MQVLQAYLANIDQLTATSHIDDKKTYIHPKLKNLACVSIVLIREAIAPVVFRNAEQEITDIECSDNLYVRAVPNKFKYIERGRGLQILRALGVGGKQAQNKTVLYKGQKVSDAFDLNTLVFGDSANYENRVLPVRSAINYSDALSIKPKEQVVDSTFHNRAMEDGTLFDAETKKNSDNLFTRHFIKPGTLMVQVLSTRGQVLPEIGLKHLLLSVGLAGSYGGQTSVTGVNIKTHIVGIYADPFEQAISSPYELLKQLQTHTDSDLVTIKATLHELLQTKHATSLQGAEVQQWQQALIKAFEQNGSPLEQEYKAAQPKVAALFNEWFS
ncbi:MAG: type I-D CRISPR-associated protein Cas7/Csc2 [Thiothrix sp.]|nr:MAG: type I-D CRISPR-associated protein Cas7/Csc2 [Thiothrix sp.]